jgi:hypothetical protein
MTGRRIGAYKEADARQALNATRLTRRRYEALPTFAASVIQTHIDELPKAPGIAVWTLKFIDDFAGPDPSLRELAITCAEEAEEGGVSDCR